MDFDIILNVSGYYLEGFHFWGPGHNLMPSFRELPTYNRIEYRHKINTKGKKKTNNKPDKPCKGINTIHKHKANIKQQNTSKLKPTKSANHT